MEVSNLETAAEAMRIVVERGFIQQCGPQAPGSARSAPSIEQTAQQLAAAVQAVDASERSTCIELSIRRAITNCLDPQRASKPDVVEFLKVVCDTMLSISSGGAGHSLAEAAVAFRILEDVFEAVPIANMEAAWKVVDDRRSAWHALVQTGQNARLALLRLTSGLLRRLSRTQDTVMCGKVLLFLAFIIPLSERSGVNLSGAFNTENTTAYEGEQEDYAQVVAPAFAYRPPSPAAPPAPIRAAAVKSDAPRAAEKAADVTLDGRFALRPCYDAVHDAYLAAQAGSAAASTPYYRAFWRLQHLFMHPSSVSGSVEAWHLFVGTVRAVLRGFEHEDVTAGTAEPRPNAPSAVAAPPPPGAAPAPGQGGKSAGSKHEAPLPPALPTLALVTQDKFVPLTQRPLVAMTHVAAKGGESGAGSGAGAGVQDARKEGRAEEGASSTGHHRGAAAHIGSGSKYLTAPSLLSLELRDASLRRHVLLQCLVALQYYTLPRKNDKDSPAAAYPAALTSDVPQLREACSALLRRMQPDGAAFASAIAGILEREAHWSSWKVGGAQDIARPLKAAPPPPLAADAPAALASGEQAGAGQKRGRPQDEGGSLRPSSKFARRAAAGGARPLEWASRGLMTDEQLLALCKDANRAVRPSMTAYLVPYVLACDPASGIDAEFSPAADRTYLWRGQRIVAQQALHALVAAHTQAAQAHAEQVSAAAAAAAGKSSEAAGPQAAAGPTGPATFRAAVIGATGVRLPEPQPPVPVKEAEEEDKMQEEEGTQQVASADAMQEEEEEKGVDGGLLLAHPPPAAEEAGVSPGSSAAAEEGEGEGQAALEASTSADVGEQAS